MAHLPEKELHMRHAFFSEAGSVVNMTMPATMPTIKPRRIIPVTLVIFVNAVILFLLCKFFQDFKRMIVDEGTL